MYIPEEINTIGGMVRFDYIVNFSLLYDINDCDIYGKLDYDMLNKLEQYKIKPSECNRFIYMFCLSEIIRTLKNQALKDSFTELFNDLTLIHLSL